jgi:glycosyltransferase involved in cell wall biosynthesis
MNKISKFIAVIPAYNEEQHIGQLVSRVLRQVSVIVVDDGSTDHTSWLAEKAGAEVVCLPSNQGKGAALRAGFLKALDHGYEAVITLDGDGQHDPDEIHIFTRMFNTRPVDLIIGMRCFTQMPLSRRIANTTGRVLFTWAMGQSIPDNQSGYRLLSRHFMETILNSAEQGFEFEVEMLEICLRQHFNLEWVPIRTIYSGEASHIHPLAHMLNFVRIVWLTRQRMRKPFNPVHA